LNRVRIETELPFLKITPYGAPLLRKQSLLIEQVDDEIKQLIVDMTETMHAANGVGLAAPQVGVSKMLMIINWSLIEDDENSSDMRQDILAYINPQIIESNGAIVETEEGCLSLPEVWGNVMRPDEIRIKYLNQNGDEIEEELHGFHARVFQHEIDHLYGILFIDRMSPKDRAQVKDSLQAILDGRVKPFDPNQINS
jgi:peptide deformylase